MESEQVEVPEAEGNQGGSDELEELINTLDAQRSEHEKAGNFLEADKVHQRILKLKQEQKKRKEDALAAKQAKEIADIEKAYEEELKNFNDEYDQRTEKYKAECQEEEDQLVQKQTTERETTRKTLEDTIPLIPKHSSEILNLTRIKETLVRNKEYKDAHAIQQKIFELEEEEKKTWGVERNAKIEQNMAALARKQENEINSFRKRAKTGFDELKKEKAVRLESLLKKYQNLRKEIKIAHKLEKNRLDGRHTTGSGIFKDSVNASSRAIFSPKVNPKGDEEKESPEAQAVEAS